MRQVQIDFPDAPVVSDRPERQEQFVVFYDQLKTAILRRFEELDGDSSAATVTETRDFPTVVTISARAEKQLDFKRWYEQFVTCLVREFEVAEAFDVANKAA